MSKNQRRKITKDVSNEGVLRKIRPCVRIVVDTETIKGKDGLKIEKPVKVRKS